MPGAPSPWRAESSRSNLLCHPSFKIGEKSMQAHKHRAGTQNKLIDYQLIAKKHTRSQSLVFIYTKMYIVGSEKGSIG